MKRLIVYTALILISLTGKVYAQYKDNTSNTDAIFNPDNEQLIRARDIVIKKDYKFTLDLFNIQDYNLFVNIDSILINFQKDIAFYKDSLEDANTANVRIDYIINPDKKVRKIHFRKYPVNGQSFVKRNGDLSRLKLELDTVHIVIERQINSDSVISFIINKRNISFYSPELIIQLNNYSDVSNLIADKEEIKRIIDTLRQAKQPYLNKQGVLSKHLSTVYRPDGSNTSYIKRYKEYSGIIKNENDFRHLTKEDFLTSDFNMGIGLIRNTLAPSADLGLQVIKGWRRYGLTNGNNFFGLYFQPIFFFEKNERGDYITNTNGFLNFHYGAQSEEDMFGLKLRKTSLGVGYLVLNKGNYFKKNTFKLFADMQLLKGITVSPELIITDNGKQIFPGITFKVF